MRIFAGIWYGNGCRCLKKNRMVQTSENNKRIAKNTVYLYFRMFITLIVGLYTSRVVLQTLGIEDYGIYNVVGGVVVMFSFINNSMATATQRFITYALGKGDNAYLEKVFSTSILIFFAIALLIVLLAETVGLWFLCNKMQVPAERMHAALWVYQFSILAAVIGVLSIPYNAVIIAYEKMGAFAYLSIFDVILRLLIVFALVISPVDKLILYAALVVLVQFLIFLCYKIYCKRHFAITSFRFLLDKNLFKEMFVFSGWTMTGNISVVCYTQGLNILLNLFFGPAVNAARGVAVQVQTVVRNFCVNFQTAINPQITKSYVQSDMCHLHNLIVTSSKFSFFLLFFISLPIMLEATFILRIWLGTVPEHTENFIRLILLTSMIIALSNPLIIALQATGHIKKFQIAETSVLMCNPFVSYFLLKFADVPPESVFVVQLCLEVCAQYVRVRIILPHIQMTINEYLKGVIYPILKVVCVAPIIPLIVFYSLDYGVLSFFIVSIVTVISVSSSVYLLACTGDEKYFVKSVCNRLASKLKRR